MFNRCPCARDKHKYGRLLRQDFQYFKTLDSLEQSLERDEKLKRLDEGLKEFYFKDLDRFYRLFDSIFKYAMNLIRYVSDLEEGLFLQYDLDTIFQNETGKQLMVSTYIRNF